MNTASQSYLLWIDQSAAVASFHPVSGYEQMSFQSRELYQAKLWILMQSGFRFQ